MVNEKDRIDIEVDVDADTKPLHRTAASLDDLGREADEASGSLEGLEKQQDKTGKSTDRLAKQLVKGEQALADSRAELKGLREELREATGDTSALEAEIVRVEKSIKRQNTRMERLARTYKGYTSAADEATESTSAFNDEQEESQHQVRKSEGMLRRLWRNMRSGGGTVGSVTKRFFKWGKVLAKFGLIGVTVATGIAFLGTAVKGLGAAGYAGVAGLAPLTGMLIAYPGLIASVLQSVGTMKLATAGMGDMIGVFANPDATAEEIEEATKGMAQNQIKFARAVADSANGWKAVKRHVGREFFDDMDDTYRRVSKTYMPIMDKYLSRQAVVMNNLAQRGADYLMTFEGQKTVATIMQNNVKQSRNYGKALGSSTRLLGILLMTSGPMLVRMSKDVAEFTDNLADNADSKRGKLRQFFNGSYKLMKSVIRVTGYYSSGLYNIGKNSEALGDFMGQSIEDTGKRFEEWSKSPEGIKDTQDFFEDMIPVTKELGYWLRDIWKLGFSMDSDDFVKASKALREQAIPRIADAFDFLADHTVPIIERLVRLYDNLKEGGVVGGLGRALDGFFTAIEGAAKFVAKLPDDVQKALAFATGLYAAYRILKRVGAVGGLAKLASVATGGKIGAKVGVQKVWVVNMPAGGVSGKGGKGGAVVVPTGGGDDIERDSKDSRRQRAAKGLGMAGFLLTATHPDTAKDIAATAFDNANAWAQLINQPIIDKLRVANTSNPIPEWTKDLEAGATITDRYAAKQRYLAEQANRLAEVNPRLAQSYKKQADHMAGILAVGEKTQPFMDSLFQDTVVPGISSTEALNGQMNALGKKNPTPTVTVVGAEKAKSDAQGITNAINNIPKNPSVLVTIKAALKASGGLFKDALEGTLYTGGATKAGGKYLVGELGPEAWMSKSGVMKMLGQHGPEVVTPGAGAVLPAGFTQDPSKDHGLAPEWAAKAYRKAAAGTQEGAETPTVRRQPRDSSRASDRPILVDQSGWQIGPGTDPKEVARLAKKAVKDAIKEAEERS